MKKSCMVLISAVGMITRPSANSTTRVAGADKETEKETTPIYINRKCKSDCKSPTAAAGDKNSSLIKGEEISCKGQDPGEVSCLDAHAQSAARGPWGQLTAKSCNWTECPNPPILQSPRFSRAVWIQVYHSEKRQVWNPDEDDNLVSSSNHIFNHEII